jgi:phosphate transport system substrate-binding protein
LAVKNQLRRKKRYLKEQLQLVDETLEPVVEDEITIFRTNIKPRSYWSLGLKRSDASVLTSRIVILSRKLNEEESKYFEQLNIKPKTQSDAIALFQIK